MRSDEIHHGITAQKHGAKNIPSIIKKIMNITADVMKVASFRL
jgi:demethoxyubiquinone hydroxylase (CLK1/Coq7/Cat5 family)